MQEMQINHKDGNKLNNELTNLEWATQRENTIHALKTGLFKPVYGEDHCCATINDAIANEICMMLVSRKYTHDEISKKLQVSKSIIQDIAMKKSWKHISKNYDFKVLKQRLPKSFTFDEIKKCCEYFVSHPKSDDMPLRKYITLCLQSIEYKGEINDSNINSIRLLYNRKRYTSISEKYDF